MEREQSPHKMMGTDCLCLAFLFCIGRGSERVCMIMNALSYPPFSSGKKKSKTLSRPSIFVAINQSVNTYLPMALSPTVSHYIVYVFDACFVVRPSISLSLLKRERDGERLPKTTNLQKKSRQINSGWMVGTSYSYSPKHMKG